jgi:hypothetical protein
MKWLKKLKLDLLRRQLQSIQTRQAKLEALRQVVALTIVSLEQQDSQ